MLLRQTSLVFIALVLSCDREPVPETPSTPTPILSFNPFPDPIEQTEGVIRVACTEFARLPILIFEDTEKKPLDGGTAKMMVLVAEPDGCRLFVNDMRGPLYSVSYDGAAVNLYLDLGDPKWELHLDFLYNGQKGFQSFAFHPQYNQPGTPGFGRFYTFGETSNKEPQPDYAPKNRDEDYADTVLLEWTAQDPAAALYDGGPPRELLRIQQPYKQHNGGLIAFNPGAAPGDVDFGNLYVSVGDGGAGGTGSDPHDQAQDLGSIYGKILRIDPLGSDSTNGQYGIPQDNPFVGQPGALGETYAYGMRHPQRFGWDVQTGTLYVADIGERVVEEISIITPGANLGWNQWEGSFRFHRDDGFPVNLRSPRSDPDVTFPIVEFDQKDALAIPRGMVAVTGIVAYRGDAIPQLKGKLLFGDLASGEVFYIDIDPWQDRIRRGLSLLFGDLVSGYNNGGQNRIRRVLLNHAGEAKRLLQLINASRREQGMPFRDRADLRFGTGPDGQIFLLNKNDGIIRRLGQAPYSTCAH